MAKIIIHNGERLIVPTINEMEAIQSLIDYLTDNETKAIEPLTPELQYEIKIVTNMLNTN